MAASMLFIPCFLSGNAIKAIEFSLPKLFICKCAPKFAINNAFSLPKCHLLPTGVALSKRFGRVCCRSLSSGAVDTISYEFSDSTTEVELRLKLGSGDIQSSRDISVDADESSLTIRKHCTESPITLIETNNLYGRIKPAETIWYLDEDQLVVNLKKQDPDLKWPDIMESWESLTVGVAQLLKGTSIYIVGESTEINQKIAQKLAVGLGYTPLNTGELLEEFSKQDVDSWVKSEGVDSVAEVEAAILESLSSHVRAVVATLGGSHGAAGRADKWRHLYAGFTVWLSKSKASDPVDLMVSRIFVNSYYRGHQDEDSAREEARRNIQEGSQGYSNADVVVKLGGWDPDLAQTVAQASLSALKQLILSDKKLPGKKSLYIRLGCRGDWPNIKPPGWDPSAGANLSPE